ncbi:MAG TPA: phosphopantetheine-binding protein [Usitatibacter sp.]|jgi:acyl carrier protein|nr:phosphopantetheine-binding protein [Usitatibacter sp.]
MSVLDRLKQLLERDFSIPPASLEGAATLESLDIDSLRLIEIVFAVEDEFKVTMPQDQGEIRDRVKTLGDLADLIEGLGAAKAGG